MARSFLPLRSCAGFLLCAFTVGAPASLDVDGTRIMAADSEPGNWISHGRNYAEERYSPLDAVNTETVDRLGLAWYTDLGTKRGLEATPLVIDGILYFTGTYSEVIAVDGRTGKVIWRNDLDVDRSRAKYMCCDVVNRGMAVWKGRLYVGTIDGRLIALDPEDGSVIWDKLTVDLERPYSITGAPRVVNGKVLIGNGGGELGVRGYISAYDAETGEMLWRFYTVPGNPDEPFENPILERAAETWGGGPWWEIGGGGTVWDSMAYDPELDLLYIGVGNGTPWNKHVRSPSGGDNLFLSSIVALDPNTGEYVWHYQTTPGDGWDYTATQHLILADLEIEGEQREVIMQAPKNGFFYVLDRATGELISAENYVPVSWAEGIDMQTGRPIETDNDYSDGPVYQFPSPMGGHNWQPMCYSRDTGYVYIPARQLAMVYRADADFEYEPEFWNVGMDVMKDITVPPWMDAELVSKVGSAMAAGFLLAWDPIKQEAVWRADAGSPWNSGALCTGGGLVFDGTGRGQVRAIDAASGDILWSFDAQQGIIGSPVTYTIDGEQYVSILVGWGGAFGMSFGFASNTLEAPSTQGRLMTFKLDAGGQLPPVRRQERVPEPPESTASSDTLDEGNALYHHYCVYCHGPRGISHPNIADLRTMDATTHRNFLGIVLGGAQADEGMPGFADTLDEEEAMAIHAYLIELGHQELDRRRNEGTLWGSIKSAAYSFAATVVSGIVSLLEWLKNAAG
ncbi:PQQ-dependent dehydrogenase, methanol/ethanol family [Algiphilus sp.]|uniref:PQQ-dependent dehydrogenase, methanol/ethanol family n=1 Tax=Algiphilus sp. TaxID=1872431 RepID=UPI0025B87854|nr:PQQ-dependent dehydrogenase, methanol/ethanol family [Algiphilus sp.]MCK5770141.1 PQQ-dependent dehydrogenase, methanol/ethanol family [Algiphilus sp.]